MNFNIFALLIIIQTVTSHELGTCMDKKDECQFSEGFPEVQTELLNESLIGRQGHWHGIKPIKYTINLLFGNLSHYRGSMDIEVKVMEETDKILINHGITNPYVDYDLITVKPLCDHPCHDIPIEPRYYFKEAAIGLHVKNGTLKSNQSFVVSIQSFEGKVGNFCTCTGANGLELSFGEDSEQEGDFAAVTTVFQMRKARSAFPCMDHPALKAVFEFCVEYPPDLTVASNTIANQSISSIGTWKMTCFEPTVPMSTYLFTFAVMKNYSVESIRMSDGPLIEVYGPTIKLELLRWVLNESIPILQYMQNITGHKFPMKRLGHVVAYPFGGGLENYGLIAYHGDWMEDCGNESLCRPIPGYTVLAHEIVHQWIGNLITNSEWTEICLQEGLTTYISWIISANRKNVSIDENLMLTRNYYKEKMNYYVPIVSKGYLVSEDYLFSTCYTRPALYYHPIGKSEGIATMERFVRNIVRKAAFSTFTMDMYNEAMNEATQSNPALNGFMNSWFLNPGPVYVSAIEIPNSDCIKFRQKVYGTHEKANIAKPIPMEVSVYGPNSANSTSSIAKSIVITKSEERICGFEGLKSENTSFLADPDAVTLTRKAYTASNYYNFVKRINDDPQFEKKRIFSDFCNAFMDNVLPLANDPNANSASEWSYVFEFLRNNMQLFWGKPWCQCCLSTKEDIQKASICQIAWNMECRYLRLNQVLGRDYEIADREIEIPVGDN